MTVTDQNLVKFLEAFPEIVIVIDAHANLLWANALAQQLFGQPLTSALSISAIDLVHPDDLELVLRSLETVQEKEIGSPLKIRTKIGESGRLIELIGTPVSWFEDGAVLFSIRDLTDRRRCRTRQRRCRTLSLTSRSRLQPGPEISPRYTLSASRPKSCCVPSSPRAGLLTTFSMV